MTEMAPYDIHLGEHEFIGTVEQWQDVSEPKELDQKTVDQFIHR